MDDHTIEAARRGDREARARLLHDLQDVWYRVSLSLLRQTERARDAAQETALRFLRDLPNFRGQSQLRTWSMGIAINVAREMRRKESRRTDRDSDLTQLAMDGGATISPDVATAQNEERETLKRLLDDLPERQREVIVLRFFEDLPVSETARAMNCAEGTVKATLFQAIRALRSKMTQPKRS